MRRDSGFTLVELLVVIGMTAVLLTLGASALRNYWLQQAVDAAAEEVESAFRELQQRTVAESHPMIYGAWFKVGAQSGAQWGSLRFDPKDPSTASDDTCTPVGSPRTFDSGVRISSASFDPPVGIGSTCSGVAPAGSVSAYFYARGSATGGSVTLYHPQTGRSRTVTVSAVTGRVDQQ